MDESLHSNQDKLNEEFFRRQNAELLENLRSQISRTDELEELAKASGISNQQLLTVLLDTGISAQTLPAVKLVPLLAVAWADAAVQPAERTAILQAANSQGISQTQPAYALLERWLNERPPVSLFEAWKTYVRSLCAALSPGGIRMLREEVLDGAEQVARAAGGFLGIQTVSAAEARVMKELHNAFVGAD